MWKFTGQKRPSFAEVPAPGQESVWDYPRPPRIEPFAGHVEVTHNGSLLADTRQALRILETASPPTFYLPLAAVFVDRLVEQAGASVCEWKGRACYFGLAGGTEPVAWRYPEPTAEFAAVANCLSFFPGRVECHVDGERVRPQPGGFYGGWVTDSIAGPYKGDPGTGHW